MNPNEKGFVSAGADKELKFWEFGALREEAGMYICMCMYVGVYTRMYSIYLYGVWCTS